MVLWSKKRSFALVALSALVMVYLWTVSEIPLNPNAPSTKTILDSHNAATGLLFGGKKKRSFVGKLMCSHAQFEARDPQGPNKVLFTVLDSHKKKNCPLWAVVTTINEPTESIRRVVELTKKKSAAQGDKWCVVIVGDTETPDESYMGGTEPLAKNSNVVYLSASDQAKIHHDFVRTIPFRSFARKNIGYLYAIAHGAQAIFDFDDDNVLKPDTVLYSLLQGNRQELFQYFPCQESPEFKSPAFNPFPLMKPSENGTWPRGFPIQYVQYESLAGPVAMNSPSFGSLPRASVGVIQSTCDGDPDVDAIYRLTRPLPITFGNEREASKLLIPPERYSPYNAQATVHTLQAFWGLLLPLTVTGRVADIWRSYFTQRIMKDLHLVLLYSPPIVIHNRSEHNYLADLQAEDDLYHKTAALLQFLKEWTDEEKFLPARIEKLAISLYEHDYIGLPDIRAMQLWLISLKDVGYEFLLLPSTSTSNVVLPELTEQPSLHGQPFLARPHYNVDAEGNTYREYMMSHNSFPGSKETWEQWKSQLQPLTITNTSSNIIGAILGKRITRPHSLVLKIVMMTKDEWPLLKYWTVYHGELLGFENLYIIDDSSDPRCTSFLRHARDHWGTNVIFSTADLNYLASEMSSIGEQIQGSSDLTMKLDTDEFFVVNHPDSPDNKLCVDLGNCTLSPWAVSDFLRDFEYWSTTVHGQPLSALYVSSSYPNRTLCDQGRGNDIAHFPMGDVTTTDFKAVSDSRSFRGYDLGSHSNFYHEPMSSWHRDRVRVGIIHLHHRCYYHEVSNSKKAVMGHNYINPSQTDQEVLQHLIKNYVGPQGACNISLAGMKKKLLAITKSIPMPSQLNVQNNMKMSITKNPPTQSSLMQ